MIKVQNLWAESGISFEDLDKSFTNFEIWNVASGNLKNKAADYSINFKKNKNNRVNSLMLCGNPGCGKTHLALSVANKLLKSKVGVIYMPYRDVITKLKQNMIDENYYKNTINRYKNCEVLLIDDLFKGKINESDINIMFEIVNHRYLKRLPIIVSTELLVDGLMEFDQAIASRLVEMSKDYLIEIKDIKNNYRVYR